MRGCIWTTGLFFSENRQHYLEQIHDPMLKQFWQGVAGIDYTDIFTDQNGNPRAVRSGLSARTPISCQTHAKDHAGGLVRRGDLLDHRQPEGHRRRARLAHQVFLQLPHRRSAAVQHATSPKAATRPKTPSRRRSTWPTSSHPTDMCYATYAKGYRPGGANNPLPAGGLLRRTSQNFGITESPATYDSDTVNSFEIGTKNNLANRFRIATSVYYISWHNIQQTVVPPICQISFIANLGEAVAKGADIQADILVTRCPHGRNLRRLYGCPLHPGLQIFTRSQATARRLLAAMPITGHSGQPNPPFTASVGLEYHFAAFGARVLRPHRLRVRSRGKWLPPSRIRARCSSTPPTTCCRPRTSCRCARA